MKRKLLTTLLFFISHFIYSQTVKGRVVANNYAVANVEIVNANSKELTVSDANGSFSITAKTNEALVFISKEHELKKIIINPKLFIKNELIVELMLKAEELNEVTITNMPSIKLSKDAKWEQAKLDQYTLEKNASKLKNPGVYDGTIENGMDIMRIGGMIFKLFTKKKDAVKKVATEPIDFITLAKTNCDRRFFLETLQLKPDQIDLFLQFCENDPKSSTLLNDSNELAVMEFLLNKHIEFKKL
jgi:hypothetical protein